MRFSQNWWLIMAILFSVPSFSSEVAAVSCKKAQGFDWYRNLSRILTIKEKECKQAVEMYEKYDSKYGIQNIDDFEFRRDVNRVQTQIEHQSLTASKNYLPVSITSTADKVSDRATDDSSAVVIETLDGYFTKDL